MRIKTNKPPGGTACKLDRVVWIERDRMSGASCFAGMRVPVQTLLDHLKHGDTIDDFLEGTPSLAEMLASVRMLTHGGSVSTLSSHAKSFLTMA